MAQLEEDRSERYCQRCEKHTTHRRYCITEEDADSYDEAWDDYRKAKRENPWGKAHRYRFYWECTACGSNGETC